MMPSERRGGTKWVPQRWRNIASYDVIGSGVDILYYTILQHMSQCPIYCAILRHPLYAAILRYMTNKCFCIAQFPWGQGMPRGVGCRLGWGTTVHTNQDLTGPKHVKTNFGIHKKYSSVWAKTVDLGLSSQAYAIGHLIQKVWI